MQKLCKPFKQFTLKSVTQGFSHPNHVAVDFTAPFGTFLVAPFNCKITVIIGSTGVVNNDTSYLERGCGIRMVSIEDPKVSVVYWHTETQFPVEVGDTVMQGQPVAQMGNTGNVRTGTEYVPITDRFLPPYRGTHCHCTLNLNADEADGFVDILQYIDYTIPINYDLMTAVKSILSKVAKLLSGK